MIAMPRTEVGTRVGAILSSDEDSVKLYGYGTYVGDFEAPLGPFGVEWEDFDRMSLETLGQEAFNLRMADGILHPKNPKIVLDSGRVVWGMECWWGPEERVKETIGNRKIIDVEFEG
jgi:hypothetical protein